MNAGAGQRVGRVAALWRYPVKSMAGEPLERADVSWDGVAGDRRWAFVRPGLERSNFPWMTIRERSDMGSYRPAFADPTRPEDSPTVVHTPAGRELDVADPRLAAELGEGVRLIKQNRGVFDAAPLSLITMQSVADLAETVGAELDARRFRPNLVVDAPDGGPIPEDRWLGRVLRVGATAIRVDRRDSRCVIVNVDPDSSKRNPGVLRAIARQRDSCTGLYASTVEPGAVVVGDPVVLLD